MHPLLRPAKVRNAIRRRLFEARVKQAELEPCSGLVHLGTEYGGWWVPGELITSEWLCYSVGTGADVSFDLALLRDYGVRIRAFDPFHVFGEMAVREANDDPRYSFHEVAIAPSDGPLEMFGRQDAEQGSVSAVNLYGIQTQHVKEGRTLPSLMEELGDRQVQLLKLDVEGLEYEIVPKLDLAAMGVQVLCLELHHNEPARRALSLLATLARQGYTAVHRKDPSSFTLLRATDEVD